MLFLIRAKKQRSGTLIVPLRMGGTAAETLCSTNKYEIGGRKFAVFFQIFFRFRANVPWRAVATAKAAACRSGKCGCIAAKSLSHYNLRETSRCGEMADATDLKSVPVKTGCGFESRHRH